VTDDRTIDVIVEIPKGSRNKYEYDSVLGGIKFDRLVMSAAVYPTDYGFLRGTLGEDGDALDALVCLTEPTFPGCVIEVDVIGMFAMSDENGPDHKMICVPLHDPYWNGYRDIVELPALFRDEIEQFFSVYKVLEPNKHVTVEGWASRVRATEVITEAQERYERRDRS